MTEAEWLALRWCETAYQTLDPHAFDRKLRLFAVGCARATLPLAPDEISRAVIDACETCADTLDSTATVQLASAVHEASRNVWTPLRVAVMDLAARGSASYAHSKQQYWQGVVRLAELRVERTGPYARPHLRTEAHWHEQYADLNRLRCTVGNPFRKAIFDPVWQTSTAVAIAEGAYADRAFDRLPVLADALEDAGCDTADLLAHLRGPGPHARGCWALDAVLGKT